MKRNILRGMGFVDWLKLLTPNLVSIKGLSDVSRFTLNSLTASFMNFATTACFYSRLRSVEIAQDPIFVIGHWRSGTTLLHELLALDKNNNYPTNFQCIFPGHFLLTEQLLKSRHKSKFLKKRPMDDMVMDLDSPQEDEFALLQLGVASFYRGIAFPRHLHPISATSLDLELLTDKEKALWRSAFVRFVRMLTLKDSRRIVFKSPTHTAHIKSLIEIFPNARFIHIVRKPEHVYASTKRLWNSLFDIFGMQGYDQSAIGSLIIECFDQMYQAFDRDMALIPKSNFAEIRYEDLINKPIDSVVELYNRLNIGVFSPDANQLAEKLSGFESYRPKEYTSDEGKNFKSSERWVRLDEEYYFSKDTL